MIVTDEASGLGEMPMQDLDRSEMARAQLSSSQRKSRKKAGGTEAQSPSRRVKKMPG